MCGRATSVTFVTIVFSHPFDVAKSNRERQGQVWLSTMDDHTTADGFCHMLQKIGIRIENRHVPSTFRKKIGRYYIARYS